MEEEVQGNSAEGDGEGGVRIVVGIVVVILFAINLFAICFYCCCLCRERRKPPYLENNPYLQRALEDFMYGRPDEQDSTSDESSKAGSDERMTVANSATETENNSDSDERIKD